MNILQVSPAYFPAVSIGGPIFSTLSLARTIRNNGHQLVTLTTPLGLDEREAKDITFNTLTQGQGSGVLVYQPYSGYPHFTWSPASFRWLRDHARKFDLCVLHGVWNFPLLAAAWVCQRQGIPYVLYPHGTLYPETVNLRSRFKKRFMLALFVNRMLECAARVVFTTSDESRKVQAFLGLSLRSTVVPNVVDSDEFERLPPRGSLRQDLGISSDTALLLHLGRIAVKKGLDTSVDVVARLRGAGRKVALVIAGGDETGLRAKLEDQARNLGILDHVYFTGLLGRERAAQSLADADVFLLPSLSENFGMAVVEAMLARVPVVISDHVGIAEDVSAGNAGIVVALSDGAAGFADAVGRLLDSDAYRAQLGESGRRFALDNYSQSAVSGQVERLLNDVTLEGRHGQR